MTTVHRSITEMIPGELIVRIWPSRDVSGEFAVGTIRRNSKGTETSYGHHHANDWDDVEAVVGFILDDMGGHYR